MVLLTLALGLLANTHAQREEDSVCGSLKNKFGPFEYRANLYRAERKDLENHADVLWIVEQAHYTSAVQAFVDEKTGMVGKDLDYTLRAFPNHHRALATLIRWWDRTNSLQPKGLPRPIECYFIRAQRFRPDDTAVALLYSSFLKKLNRIPEAMARIDHATNYAKDNPLTLFNIGLMYLEVGAFEKAQHFSQLARNLGMNKSDIEEKLRAMGHWRERVISPEDSDTSQDSAASSPGGK